MLFQVGPITCDTFPFEVGETEREVNGDYAKHDLLGARKDYEFAGPGDEALEISGQVLPYHEGGMNEIETAMSLARSGSPVFVVRGDGMVLGWFQLMSVREKGSMISPSGVGFVIKYSLRLERIDAPGSSIGAGLIGTLLSLFG